MSVCRIAGAIFRIHELNEKTTFEIFIHKVDGMSETYRQGQFHLNIKLRQ
jgi:hypothetical protein